MKAKFNIYSLIIFILFAFLSCDENNENTDAPAISFDSIVDSTFVSDIEINGERIFYKEHLRTYGYIERHFESDSVIVGFNMFFAQEQEDILNIKISRKLAFDSLITFTVDSFKYIGALPANEFIKIFNQTSYGYAKYDNTYIWEGSYEYFSNTSSGLDYGLYYPQITEGAAISFEHLDGSLADTKYLIKYLDYDSIDNFYAESYFRLTHVNYLDDCNIIISGNFELEIYNTRGQKFHIKCLTFKGFVQNYINRNCH